MISHHRYLALLAALFAVLWIALAIAPLHRTDWALENVLVLLGAVAIALSWRHITLSRASYTLIFLFLCLQKSARTTRIRKSPTTRGSPR